MSKRRKYSDQISAKDWIEKNLDDIWEEMKKLKRAIRVAALITLITVSVNHKSIKRLVNMSINKINKTFVHVRK